jgi:hypothetical protein
MTCGDYESYEYYSGDPGYPVGLEGYSGEAIFYVGLFRGVMWDRATEYGRRRFALCDWVADLIDTSSELCYNLQH